MVHLAVTAAREHALATVVAPYRATAKNKPCLTFWRGSGFASSEIPRARVPLGFERLSAPRGHPPHVGKVTGGRPQAKRRGTLSEFCAGLRRPFGCAAADRVGERPVITGRPHLRNEGTMRIGDDFRFASRPAPSHLVTLKGVTSGNWAPCLHRARRGDSAHLAIHIGDDTRLGPFVVIMDSDSMSPAIATPSPNPAPVHIGKSCVDRRRGHHPARLRNRRWRAGRKWERDFGSGAGRCRGCGGSCAPGFGEKRRCDPRCRRGGHERARLGGASQPPARAGRYSAMGLAWRAQAAPRARRNLRSASTKSISTRRVRLLRSPRLSKPRVELNLLSGERPVMRLRNRTISRRWVEFSCIGFG